MLHHTPTEMEILYRLLFIESLDWTFVNYLGVIGAHAFQESNGQYTVWTREKILSTLCISLYIQRNYHKYKKIVILVEMFFIRAYGLGIVYALVYVICFIRSQGCEIIRWASTMSNGSLHVKCRGLTSAGNFAISFSARPSAASQSR